MSRQTLNFVVRGRSGTVLDTKVYSLTTFSDLGKFDVLPGHGNFIGLIHKELTYVDESEKKQSMPIDTAILRVQRNQIEIYIGLE